jgi:hypothetical protein
MKDLPIFYTNQSRDVSKIGKGYGFPTYSGAIQIGDIGPGRTDVYRSVQESRRVEMQ